MNCIWREHARGFYHCKNCKLPASRTKQWLKGLPPARNCANPSAQFLLGDFLEGITSRMSEAAKLRWGKRIDALLGTNTGDLKRCACDPRKRALNDWTLRIVALPAYKRPLRIGLDVAGVLVKTFRHYYSNWAT